MFSKILKFALLGALALGLAIPLVAQESAPRNLLSGPYPAQKLKTLLVPRAEWHPYPTAAERPAWEALPDPVRKAHVEQGEKALGYAWPALSATLLLDYARNGDRTRHKAAYNERRERLAQLALAECMEGKGRFVDQIANGLWAICEESSWVIPAHLDKLQKAGKDLPDVAEPTVDLFGAETGSLVAWVTYLHGPALDGVSPLIRRRVRRELDQRILTPNLQRDDFWWMKAAMNWNPWICSNWLTVALLAEEDEPRRQAAVAKVTRTLDNFLNSYPADGGCDEGPGYWSHAPGSLFDCLELLRSATAGGVSVYNQPLIHDMARFIYRAHIADDRFVNFADAAPKQYPNGDLMYRFGKRIGDEPLAQFGAMAARSGQPGQRAVGGSMGHVLPALFNLKALAETTKTAAPLLRDVWLPDIQVMTARSDAGSTAGLYLAAQGGHNAENHNHNDVGNFIVYADGHPALIDVGAEAYNAKTFGPQRYDIWAMQSAYHNCPTINGVMQKAGREFSASAVAYQADDQAAALTLDLAKAYPAEAGVQSWKRTLRLNRHQAVDITDAFRLAKPSADVMLSLMTPYEVAVTEPGVLTLTGRDTGRGLPPTLRIRYDAAKLKPVIEEIDLKDARLQESWGSSLRRILLKAQKSAASDTWVVRVGK